MDMSRLLKIFVTNARKYQTAEFQNLFSRDPKCFIVSTKNFIDIRYLKRFVRYLEASFLRYCKLRNSH